MSDNIFQLNNICLTPITKYLVNINQKITKSSKNSSSYKLKKQKCLFSCLDNLDDFDYLHLQNLASLSEGLYQKYTTYNIYSVLRILFYVTADSGSILKLRQELDKIIKICKAV